MPSKFDQMTPDELTAHLVSKYALASEQGRNRLAGDSSSYPLFAGWGEAPRSRTLFALNLNRGTGDGVEPVVRHIRARTGFGFVVAGEHYPLHVTGGQVGKQAADHEIEAIRTGMQSDIDALIGAELAFNRCYATDTGEVLLTGTVLPESFRAARRLWWRVCESVLQVAPTDYDLMHISLLRVTSVPGGGDYGWTDFVKQIAEVDFDLRRRPLRFAVDSVHIGNTHRYVTSLERPVQNRSAA